jgi:hypothetical protein
VKEKGNWKLERWVYSTISLYGTGFGFDTQDEKDFEKRKEQFSGVLPD